jgi:hypothetical protein
MHSSYYITFLIKSSSKNVTKKETWQYQGCCYFLFEKKILKLFVQRQVIAHSLPGQRRNDKYTPNTPYHSWFV